MSHTTARDEGVGVECVSPINAAVIAFSMPSKQRGGGARAAARWTREELVVLFDCLRSEEFMGEHAPSLPRGLFPVISSRESGDKTTEKHALCTAIAQEILRAAGEANLYTLRRASAGLDPASLSRCPVFPAPHPC